MHELEHLDLGGMAKLNGKREKKCLVITIPKLATGSFQKWDSLWRIPIVPMPAEMFILCLL